MLFALSIDDENCILYCRTEIDSAIDIFLNYHNFFTLYIHAMFLDWIEFGIGLDVRLDWILDWIGLLIGLIFGFNWIWDWIGLDLGLD